MIKGEGEADGVTTVEGTFGIGGGALMAGAASALEGALSVSAMV